MSARERERERERDIEILGPDSMFALDPLGLMKPSDCSPWEEEAELADSVKLEAKESWHWHSSSFRGRHGTATGPIAVGLLPSYCMILVACS